MVDEQKPNNTCDDYIIEFGNHDEMLLDFEEYRKEHRIRCFYERIAGCAHRSWYYIKCWLFHPYNVVKIKSLPPTWVDADEKLLHACFKIFADFIENEKPFERLLFDYTEYIEEAKKNNDVKMVKTLEETHKDKQQEYAELTHLYDWWTKIRPEREKKYEENLIAGTIAAEDDGKNYKDDTEHLIRLIKIRQCLWT